MTAAGTTTVGMTTVGMTTGAIPSIEATGKKTVTEAGRLEPSGIVILDVPHREYVEQG